MDAWLGISIPLWISLGVAALALVGVLVAIGTRKAPTQVQAKAA